MKKGHAAICPLPSRTDMIHPRLIQIPESRSTVELVQALPWQLIGWMIAHYQLIALGIYRGLACQSMHHS